jgi:hypothetical protein
VKFIDGEFWIVKNGEILEEMGGFIDPVSPKIIIEAMRSEEKNND